MMKEAKNVKEKNTQHKNSATYFIKGSFPLAVGFCFNVEPVHTATQRHRDLFFKQSLFAFFAHKHVHLFLSFSFLPS